MDQIKTGAFLKELRKEHNLSQEQLADRFNTSSRSISRWENGKTMPDISMMIELAEFYDVDIREILRGERKSDNMNEGMIQNSTQSVSPVVKSRFSRNVRIMISRSGFSPRSSIRKGTLARREVR